MINLDSLKLADCFTPEQLADEIFRQCPDISEPIPVKEIAKSVGIVGIKSIPTDDVEGILVADDSKSTGVIYYKHSSPLGRQRFTIGHELGHFLLLHHGSNQQCTPNDIRIGKNPSKLENEANQFSQLLLMPETLVSKAVNNGKPLNMELIKSISDDFEMSFEAMANKCANLSNIPFALIYSKDRIVRYCWRDFEKFPYRMRLRKNSIMPPSSQAVKLSQPEDTISYPVEVKSSNWISINSKQSIPDVLIEQTYTQLDGYQVTMIRI